MKIVLLFIMTALCNSSPMTEQFKPDYSVYNYNQEMIQIRRFLDKDQLIVYFTEYQCETCIDQIIEALQKIVINKNVEISFWIKSSFRYIEWISKKYNLAKERVFKTTTEIERCLPDMPSPCIFLLDAKSLAIKELFITKTDDIDTMLKYLNNIHVKE